MTMVEEYNRQKGLHQRRAQNPGRLLLPKGEGDVRSATEGATMAGHMRLCSDATSRLGIVAPHPPLRGTFSLWEKDAPGELRLPPYGCASRSARRKVACGP